MRHRRAAAFRRLPMHTLLALAAMIGAAFEASAVEPAADRTAFVGVVGQVARPGVYEHPPQGGTVLDVLGRCGGLTGEASGEVRLVRDGEPVQKLSVSSKSPAVFGGDVEVRPGDILVVDERPHRPAAYETGSLPPPRDVQLAFMHLSDRPAVEKIAAQYATLRGIVMLLGQPPEVVNSIYVIPAGPPAALAGRPTLDTPLPSGSVLVFDPAVLVQERIPPLSRPYPLVEPRPLIPDAAPTEPAGTVAGTRAAAEPTAATSAMPAVEFLESPPTEADRPFQIAEQWPVPDPMDMPLPEATPLDRGRMASPGERRTAAATTFLGRFAEAGLAGGTISDTPVEYLSSGAEALDDIDSLEATNEASTGFSSAAAWVLTLLVLLGGALVVRALIRQRRAGGETPASSGRSALAVLIYNELPICEEPVRLPGSLRFFGRPGPREDETALRLDAAQGVPAPHFRPAVPQSERPQPVKIEAAHAAPKPPHAFRPRTAAPRREGGEQASGLLGRVLTSVHGDHHR